MKKGKIYQDSVKLIDKSKNYDAKEAIEVLTNMPKRKFDETEMEDRKADEQKDYKNRNSAGNTGDDSYIV